MVYEKKIKDMVKRLESMGISDKNVLKAMGQIPRHRFISDAFGFQAYDEKALPIGYKQTISHPFTVARMSEILNVSTGDKILEIGTGSGYQTAVLIALGAQVYSVEILKLLTEKTKSTLAELGYQAALKCGDGRLGWRAYAPYQAIIVTAGAPVVPKQLLSQLTIGGKMIIPIGSKEEQQLILYLRKKDGIEHKVLESFQFVPLVKKAK